MGKKKKKELFQDFSFKSHSHVFFSLLPRILSLVLQLDYKAYWKRSQDLIFIIHLSNTYHSDSLNAKTEVLDTVKIKAAI